MIINNNIPALNTHRQMGINQNAMQNSMEKLSSGLRINRAGDDAAGLAISEKMRAQINGLQQASRNAQDGISLIQTAEGALQETHDILQRMRELAVQAGNDTNVEVDREEIQKEINELTSEINRIGNTTEFNTQKLINGDQLNRSDVQELNFVGGGQRLSNSDTGLEIGLNQTGFTAAAGEYNVTVEEVQGVREAGTVDVQIAGVDYSDISGDANPTFSGDAIAVDASTWDRAQFLLTGTEGALITSENELASGATTEIIAEETTVGNQQEYTFSITVDLNGSSETLTFTADDSSAITAQDVVDGFNANAQSQGIAVELGFDGDNLTIQALNAGENFGANTSVEFTSISIEDEDSNAVTAAQDIFTTALGTPEATEGTMGDGVEITLTYNEADNTLTVENASGAMALSEDIVANSDGSFTYNNHGISFTVTDLGDWADGEEVTFTLDETQFGGTDGNELSYSITTLQEGWVTSGSDLMADTSLQAPSFVNNEFNYDQSVGEGTWVVQFSEDADGSGNDGLRVAFFEAGADVTDFSEATFNDVLLGEAGTLFQYDAHGVNFELNSFNIADNARAEFAFDEPDLDGFQVSIDGIGETIVLADENGNFVLDGNTDLRGLTLNADNLQEGTFTIEIGEMSAGQDDTLNFQIGANQNQALNLSINDMRADALGISGTGNELTFINSDGLEETVNLTSSRGVTDGTDARGVERALDVSNHENAAKAVSVLNNAIERVSAERSMLGATQNRLEHTISNLDNSAENLSAAESRIRDVDMAAEMMEMTRANILSQASQSMLAQANQQPQSVLQLLG